MFEILNRTSPRSVIMASLEPCTGGTHHAIKSSSERGGKTCYVWHVASHTARTESWIFFEYGGATYRVSFTDTGQKLPSVRAFRIGCRLTQIALDPEHETRQPGCDIYTQTA